MKSLLSFSLFTEQLIINSNIRYQYTTEGTMLVEDRLDNLTKVYYSFFLDIITNNMKDTLNIDSFDYLIKDNEDNKEFFNPFIDYNCEEEAIA